MSLNNLLVSNVKRKLHRRESSESSSNSAVEKRLKELSPLVAWMNKCATFVLACSRLSVCGERAKKRASAEKTSGDEGERRKESL